MDEFCQRSAIVDHNGRIVCQQQPDNFTKVLRPRAETRGNAIRRGFDHVLPTAAQTSADEPNSRSSPPPAELPNAVNEQDVRGRVSGMMLEL